MDIGFSRTLRAIFDPTSAHTPGKRGRPALTGKRQPKVSAVVTDPETIWTRGTVAEWYGGRTLMLDHAHGVAAWYGCRLR